MRIAAITLLAVYAVYLVVVIVTAFVIGAHNMGPLDAAVVLLTAIMLVCTVLFLTINYVYITRPQRRYQEALAEAHPGLDLDDEGSIQRYIWEREGHPDSFLPGLYNWLVWKSHETTLSPVEQVVKDVWNLDDINAEVFEFGVHVSSVEDVERIERGIMSFRAIGADKAADIWAQALPPLMRVSANTFPYDPSRQLEDWEEAELYDQLGDLNEQLYELEYETHALLYDYVMKHRAEFVSSQASDAQLF